MTFSLANYLAADAADEALRRDVRIGLTQRPKSLPPKWFYDSVGSELFDQITRLPEYYPTRAEAQILSTHAGEIAAVSEADTLVELGSGTSEKTRMLLGALRDRGSLRRFVPFDVDASVLKAAGAAIEQEYPGVDIDTPPPALAGASYAWNLITRQGQAAASGLYLYAVEDRDSGRMERGKFLIVKSDREGFR